MQIINVMSKLIIKIQMNANANVYLYKDSKNLNKLLNVGDYKQSTEIITNVLFTKFSTKRS